MNIRINKLLSDIGLGSRREVEQLVLDGRVAINGTTAELTDQVEEEDIVTLDGEELPVEDIMREYAAEQKMRIAEQLSGLAILEDYMGEDHFDAPSMRKKQGGKKGASYGGGKSFGKPMGKPAKFKKFEDDDDSFAGGRRGAKGKKPRKNFKPERRPQRDLFLENDYDTDSSFPLVEDNSYSRPRREESSAPRKRPNFSAPERRDRERRPRNDSYADRERRPNQERRTDRDKRFDRDRHSDRDRRPQNRNQGPRKSFRSREDDEF